MGTNGAIVSDTQCKAEQIGQFTSSIAVVCWALRGLEIFILDIGQEQYTYICSNSIPVIFYVHLCCITSYIVDLCRFYFILLYKFLWNETLPSPVINSYISDRIWRRKKGVSLL